MPPENPPDSFFVKHPLMLGGITAILLLAIPALWFYYESKSTSYRGSPTTEPPQEQAEVQTLLQQQITELDIPRPITTTTVQSQTKIIDTIRKQTTKQTTTTAPPPPKTLQEQIKELDR